MSKGGGAVADVALRDAKFAHISSKGFIFMNKTKLVYPTRPNPHAVGGKKHILQGAGAIHIRTMGFTGVGEHHDKNGRAIIKTIRRVEQDIGIARFGEACCGFARFLKESLNDRVTFENREKARLQVARAGGDLAR